MLLAQVRDAVPNALAYMLVTVGINKPLLLNIKQDLLKLLQYHKLQALTQVAKRPGR